MPEDEEPGEKEQEEMQWNRIIDTDKIICDNCGHSNPLGTEVCEECENPLPREEDETGYSMIVGDAAGRAKGKKVLLEDARNLKNLRKAYEGMKSGEMHIDEYRQIVKKIHSLTQQGVKLFKSDAVKKKIEGLPEEEKQLVADTQEQIERYHDGVSKMLKFLDMPTMEALNEGFFLVEDSLKILDQIQDRAFEIVANL